MYDSEFILKFNNNLLKSVKPSEFFQKHKTEDGFKETFPELAVLIGLRQNPKFHAEGDVWNHSMLVLDAAAGFRNLTAKPLAFMLSALCHDFGKAVCTEEISGVIHSYGHETKGLPLINSFLNRFSYPEDVVSYVLNMCKLHMKPNTLAVHKSSVKSSNKMFYEALYPLDLIYLGAADCLGQLPQGDAENNIKFLLERLEIFNSLMRTPFFGIKELRENGIENEIILSETMEFANKLRLAGIESGSALKQALSYARKMEKSLH